MYSSRACIKSIDPDFSSILTRRALGGFKFFMRWGLAHITAINLCQWAYIVTIEITETLIHKFAQRGGGESDGHTSDDHGENGGYPSDDHGGDDHGEDYLNNVTDYLHETITEMVTTVVGGDSHHIRKSRQLSLLISPNTVSKRKLLLSPKVIYVWSCRWIIFAGIITELISPTMLILWIQIEHLSYIWNMFITPIQEQQGQCYQVAANLLKVCNLNPPPTCFRASLSTVWSWRPSPTNCTQVWVKFPPHTPTWKWSIRRWHLKEQPLTYSLVS